MRRATLWANLTIRCLILWVLLCRAFFYVHTNASLDNHFACFNALRSTVRDIYNYITTRIYIYNMIPSKLRSLLSVTEYKAFKIRTRLAGYIHTHLAILYGSNAYNLRTLLSAGHPGLVLRILQKIKDEINIRI